jgi:hypothetical protein
MDVIDRLNINVRSLKLRREGDTKDSRQKDRLYNESATLSCNIQYYVQIARVALLPDLHALVVEPPENGRNDLSSI